MVRLFDSRCGHRVQPYILQYRGSAIRGRTIGLFPWLAACLGLSNVFAIIVFVVVGLFSLLMITGTHVTDIPEDARKLSAKIQRKPYVPKGQEPDDGNQFPNEVRVGDSTLAFAEGVPAHDSTDEESDGENKSGTAKPGLFARLFGRKPKTEDDQTLDRYAADDPFDRAASQHGATAETPVVDTATGEITGGRTIASSAYEGAAHAADVAPTSAVTAGHTVVMPSGPATNDPWAPSATQTGMATVAAAGDDATGAYAGANADGSGVGQGIPNTDDQPNAANGNDAEDDANKPYQLPDLSLLTRGSPTRCARRQMTA